MPTGYEAGMYRDVGRTAQALERIANANERIAEVLEQRLADEHERDQQPAPTAVTDAAGRVFARIIQDADQPGRALTQPTLDAAVELREALAANRETGE